MDILTDSKAISLEEQAGVVRHAFEEMQRAATPMTNEPCCLPYWIVEIYTDYIVVCESMAEYYRVDYTLTAEGVTFAAKDAWVKVEKDWIEAKGLTPDVVIFGGEIKALGNGKVGGFLVTYTTENDPDLTGKDFFDKSSDLDIEDGDHLTTYYDHGLDKTLKNRKLGRGKVEYKDAGLWMEAQLELRDAYEEAVYKMAEMGKLGWSTGPAQHLVRREKAGKSMRITHWPIKEASLTPVPAEFRNSALPLKSLPMIDLEEAIKSLPISNLEPESELPGTPAEGGQPPAGAETSTGAGNAVTVTTDGHTPVQITIVSQANGDNTMSEQNEQGTQTPNPTTPVETPEQAEIKRLSDQVTKLLQFAENSPQIMGSGWITQDGGAADLQVKSLADWAMAVQRGDFKRIKTVYPESLKSVQEDQGQTGGYMIPPSFSAELVQAQAAISPLIALCRRFPVQQPAGSWPVLDIFSAPTAGSGNTALAAGLVSSTIAEGGAYTDRNVNFEIINFRVNKVGDRVNVSDEMMADAPALDALLRQVITTHLSQKKERHILRGNGVGQPLGILNAPALINITPGTNSAFSWVDVTTMLSRFRPSGDPNRVRWVMHRSLLPDLGNLQVASGSAATWVQNIGTDNPDMLPLMRYGIYFSEHLPVADNSGDALLVDFGAYGLWERGDIRIQFSEHAGWNTGEVVWRFDERYDGQPLARAAVTQADPSGTFTTSSFVNHND